MEVSVKYPIFPIVFGNDVIMTSFIVVKLSNLHILLNITEAISPENFSFLRCLDLMLHGGGKHPPKCCTGRKKPSAFRVKMH